MKKLVFIILSLVWVAGMTGCNTMEGLGQDVQQAGESLEESAKRNKE